MKEMPNRSWNRARNVIQRVDSADWQTDDLHKLWRRTPTERLGNEVVAIHAFLDYCRILQELRDRFQQQDGSRQFDRVFFFLRGGYFAFAYLNVTFHLLQRAVIFGGLNHGRTPKEKLQSYVRSLAEAARHSGKHSLRLLVIDEVESGSGMGRILKAIEAVLLEPTWKHSLDCDLTFYAIRPRMEMSPALQAAVTKWTGERKYGAPKLSLSIEHFAGHLPGYDSDRRCGIRRTSLGYDPKENYDLVKYTKGKIRIVCKPSRKRIAFAQLEETCLVQFLAYLALSLTNEASGALLQSIRSGIDLYGCDLCKERLGHLRDRWTEPLPA